MVWNVENHLENPNESRPSDPVLANMTRALNSDAPVGEFPEEVDVKKENLRKIQQVVEQLDADIKYCIGRKKQMHKEALMLQESLTRIGEAIDANDKTHDLLSKTRYEIAQAMYNLDPQDRDVIKEPSEYTADDLKREDNLRRY